MLFYAALSTGCYRRMGHGIGRQICPILFSPLKVRKTAVFMMKTTVFGCGGRTGIAFVTGIYNNPSCVSPRFAVPEKIIGLTLFLDFFDRCTLSGLAVSAAGSARPLRPNELRSSDT